MVAPSTAIDYPDFFSGSCRSGVVPVVARVNHRKEPIMRFMMFMKPNLPKSVDWTPTADAVKEMMAFNQQLHKAGVLLTLDGLLPPEKGAIVSFHDGRPKVSDGPFAEAKEVIGGYWIIQVKSREEAIEWAKRVPPGPQHADFSIELRQIADVGDFPADVQAELVPDLHPGWR
jgi:hypothetical protein